MKDHEDLKLKKWHNEKIESVFNFLKTKEGGLSETEVKSRQKIMA